MHHTWRTPVENVEGRLPCEATAIAREITLRVSVGAMIPSTHMLAAA